MRGVSVSKFIGQLDFQRYSAGATVDRDGCFTWPNGCSFFRGFSRESRVACSSGNNDSVACRVLIVQRATLLIAKRQRYNGPSTARQKSPDVAETKRVCKNAAKRRTRGDFARVHASRQIESLVCLRYLPTSPLAYEMEGPFRRSAGFYGRAKLGRATLREKRETISRTRTRRSARGVKV